MSICLIDTTVFCNIVGIPGRDQDRSRILRLLEEHIQDGTALLLPMAAIIESGNHVARSGDGSQRRQTAKRFVKHVLAAINGMAPWVATPFFEQDELRKWLACFPDHAMKGVGLADLSIIQEFARQCRQFPARRVFIWSLDKHLGGYNRPAKT